MPDEAPLITCVIPTYRRPQLLARAIRSVLNQTFPALRVYVTDNASGDETAEVVRSFQARDPRVIYHCQPENIGMNPNFWYGMSRVETPFYSLLSDDDILLPEFYATAYAEFQKYPQAMMVATAVPAISSDGRFLGEPLAAWARVGFFDPPTGAFPVVSVNHPTITGILFRREFLSTPQARPDPEIWAMDFEMIYGCALVYPMVATLQPGAIFYGHSGVRAKPRQVLHVLGYIEDLLNRVDGDARLPDPVKQKARERWLTYLRGTLSGATVRLILDGDFAQARTALDALTKCPESQKQLYIRKNLYRVCYGRPGVRVILQKIYDRIYPIIRSIRERLLPRSDSRYLKYIE